MDFPFPRSGKNTLDLHLLFYSSRVHGAQLRVRDGFLLLFMEPIETAAISNIAAVIFTIKLFE